MEKQYISAAIKKVISAQRGDVRIFENEAELQKDNKKFKEIVLAEFSYSIIPNFLLKAIARQILNMRQVFILVYLMNNNKFLTISNLERQLQIDNRTLKKDIEKLGALKFIRFGWTHKKNAGVLLTINDISNFKNISDMNKKEIKEYIKNNAVNYSKIQEGNVINK